MRREKKERIVHIIQSPRIFYYTLCTSINKWLTYLQRVGVVTVATCNIPISLNVYTTCSKRLRQHVVNK